MQQRHKKDTTVKVCPYVPKRVRDTAERLAKRSMAKSKKPVFATPFIANWATAGHDIFTAQTDAEVLTIIERLREKPMELVHRIDVPPDAGSCPVSIGVLPLPATDGAP